MAFIREKHGCIVDRLDLASLGGDAAERAGAAMKAPRGLKPRGAGANVAFATTLPNMLGQASAQSA